MLLESLARIISICPAYHTFSSGSQSCRVLISSFNRCWSSRTTPSKETKTLPASLASLKRDFLDAVRKNDGHRAQLLRQKLRESSNDSDLNWVHNAVINMHARRRETDLAFAVATEMGSRMDSFSYAGLLNACAKAQHPPYDLPEKYAERAHHVFEEMVAKGILPSIVHYHTLMDCQAKAGKVDEAFATYEAMQQSGIPSSTRTLNILLSACSRATQPFRARETLEDFVQRGVKSDLITWNTLLSAYARAQNVDGAYEVWQDMQRSGIVPDRFTQRALSEAFGGNVALAAEIVQEAQWLQQHQGERSTGSASTSGATERAPGGKLRMHDGADLKVSDAANPMTATVSRPFFLDLHGLSQSAARIALVQRLEYLTFAHIQHALPDSNGGDRARDVQSRDGRTDTASRSEGGDSGDASQVAVQDLEIVVGKGQRSHGASVLRDAAEEILSSKGIAFQQHPNQGRLLVPSEELRRYVEAQKNSEFRNRFFHMASMQYVVVGLGLSAVLSALYVVPLILDHAV
ncbi:probable pentatricopeptide repeat-containing protein At1g0 at N-terminal half [Coccomyxa sp. Obi]|nr:probable pentatricopeptide repeat-containing protein At1g0 at N-terminal half [Coccomyxa sp. Obi]